MRYWLAKTEPDVFSFADLVAAPSHIAPWDGVRNYQVRNFIRDEIKKGDQVFIYHSSTAQPGIVGLAEVVCEAYSDDSALDAEGRYFDARAAAKGVSPWLAFDVRATHALELPLLLQTMRQDERLAEFQLLRKGQRLSIMPVSSEHGHILLSCVKLRNLRN